jgi:hypothetical protein
MMQVVTFLVSGIAALASSIGIMLSISVIIPDDGYTLKWRVLILCLGIAVFSIGAKSFYWAGYYDTCILKLPSKTQWMCKDVRS